MLIPIEGETVRVTARLDGTSSAMPCESLVQYAVGAHTIEIAGSSRLEARIRDVAGVVESSITSVGAYQFSTSQAWWTFVDEVVAASRLED